MAVTLYRSDPKLASNIQPIRADKAKLTGSDIQIWSGSKIIDLCRSPFLRNRYERWLKLAKKDRAPLLKVSTATKKKLASTNRCCFFNGK